MTSGWRARARCVCTPDHHGGAHRVEFDVAHDGEQMASPPWTRRDLKRPCHDAPQRRCRRLNACTQDWPTRLIACVSAPIASGVTSRWKWLSIMTNACRAIS